AGAAVEGGGERVGGLEAAYLDVEDHCGQVPRKGGGVEAGGEGGPRAVIRRTRHPARRPGHAAGRRFRPLLRGTCATAPRNPRSATQNPPNLRNRAMIRAPNGDRLTSRSRLIHRRRLPWFAIGRDIRRDRV